MKRVTVTLTHDLERALEAYLDDQDMPPTLTSIVQTALRQYLAELGYLPASTRFRLSPARKPSGHTDVSTRHDRHFVQIHDEKLTTRWK